jgi:hypothetical protein
MSSSKSKTRPGEIPCLRNVNTSPKIARVIRVTDNLIGDTIVICFGGGNLVMDSWVSPELSLVAACCIWPPSKARSNAICKAAGKPFNWDCVLRLAMRHRLVGLIREGLTSAHIAVPTGIATEIANQAAALNRQNLALAAEGLRIQRMFAEADLPVAFLKGISLAMLAYRNIGIRHGRDLDLLVKTGSISAASAVLQRAGYHRFEPPESFNEANLQIWLRRCKEIRYVHQDSGYEIELHARLFDNPYLMDGTSVMGPPRLSASKELSGLCTLDEEDLFSYLCAHGALHCWFRLKWLVDIGALLAQQTHGGAERLYRAAEVRGVGLCAAQAMLLCRRLFGTALPDKLLTRLNNGASIRLLMSTAIKSIASDAEPSQSLVSRTRNNLARLLLKDDWRYRLAELWNLSVNPADILLLPLPFPILYPVLRLPFSVWRNIRATVLQIGSRT